MRVWQSFQVPVQVPAHELEAKASVPEKPGLHTVQVGGSQLVAGQLATTLVRKLSQSKRGGEEGGGGG
jgi:hypothetical protein